MPATRPTAAAHDPRVDAYLAAAPAFARPILERVRADLHAGAGGLEEAIKWGRPFFLLDGRPFAYVAAFKAHCTIGFWRGGKPVDEAADGGRFARIASLADLPSPAALRRLARDAAAAERASRTEAAAAPPAAGRAPRPAPQTPADLAAALAARPAAAQAWDAFGPSHRREYVDWIVEAKREATRAARVAQALEWIAEGKPRHWKYRSG
jgi:uncharacterized protein YdeI (YjbR/CyaY-like superfamily)